MPNRLSLIVIGLNFASSSKVFLLTETNDSIEGLQFLALVQHQQL
jgi:hypothetical protein